MELEDIRAGVVGEGVVISTPYGPRRLTYCDHAASGRLYGPIEDVLRVGVMPTYANVHSETSATGAQTIAFREQARDVIRQATGCGPEDAVIFCGNGCTGAVSTLIGCLCLRDRDERALVLIGPYEHHSNEIPWREVADVGVVQECDSDGIDLDDLAAKLRLGRARGRRMLCSFSAGSNVTGRITNVAAVARICHDHGAPVFFDYAAAGPYVPLSMCGTSPLEYADAVFLSPHKFLGGPGAPGVLVMKRHLAHNACPTVPGGGTVAYVHPHRHTYLADIEHREEGGTPNVLGAIRAGLAMMLKHSVGPDKILAHEQAVAQYVVGELSRTPNVQVLGSTMAPRLGIVSFVVRASTGKALHHNFVAALLNDLFGVQARGGNSCAGPYAHRLLGLTEQNHKDLEACVARGYHGCKPGWVRISFGWYDSEETVAFVTRAVQFIATFGERFLADYSFNPRTGSWKHRAWQPSLLSLDSPVEPREALDESARDAYLDEAEALAAADRDAVAVAVEPTPFEQLRWFQLPGEST